MSATFKRGYGIAHHVLLVAQMLEHMKAMFWLHLGNWPKLVTT